MNETETELNPVVTHLLRLAPLTEEAFAPFGAIIASPADAGDRAMYTKWLGSNQAAMTPRLHVNRVAMSTLPIVIDTLERHPYSAQIFVPLEVSRFVVVVAPANEAGGPDLAMAEAFIAAGNIGVVYAPGVWHAGAAVLDRDGSFCVLMWRNDTEDDEQFFQLDALLQLRL